MVLTVRGTRCTVTIRPSWNATEADSCGEKLARSVGDRNAGVPAGRRGVVAPAHSRERIRLALLRCARYLHVVRVGRVAGDAAVESLSNLLAIAVAAQL